MEASSLRFAAAARTLGEVARAAGLVVPGFRSPPRIDGVDRTMKRQLDGAGLETITVSVRIKGRPWVSVLADMIDGVLAANCLTGPTAGAARTVMWGAVEADVMRGSNPEGPARQGQRRSGRGSVAHTGRRGPQPSGEPHAKVA